MSSTVTGAGERIFSQIIEKTREQANKCAFQVLEHINDETLRTKYLSDLEKVLTSCAESEHAVKLSRTAAQEAEAGAVDEESGQPDMKRYEEVYSESMEELQQDLDIQDVINNDRTVKAFRQHLQSQTASEMVDDDGGNEELITTQQHINLIDPISKKIMTDPVRNIHCGHVYERESVTDMIKVNRRKGFRCPSMGCMYREPLSAADLEDALDVKRQLILRQKEQSHS